MKVGDEVFFARGEAIKRGTVAKVLGTQLRVEFVDFVVIDEAMVVPVPVLESQKSEVATALDKLADSVLERAPIKKKKK